jgi:lipid-A-disaccharide synthase-like uncharacterized protein
MTELFNNVASYLHDVFIIKFDAWVVLAYALYRRDPVFIAGQALGLLVYIRNVYFIIVNGRQMSSDA